MSGTNPNYVQKNGGWVRNPNAPNVKVTTPAQSHIKWDRMKSIENMRKQIQQQRQNQNAVNQAHKQKHGG